MKNKIILLSILCVATPTYSAENKNLSEKQIRASFVACAGASAACGHYLGGRDFMTALSVYLLLQAATYRKPENTSIEPSQVAGAVVYEALALAPDALFPVAFSAVANSTPPLVGTTYPWQLFCRLIKPAPPQPLSIYWAASIVAATEGFHCWYNPLYKRKQQIRLVKKAEQEMNLDGLITALETDQEDSSSLKSGPRPNVRVQFPSWGVLYQYQQRTGDLSVGTPDEIITKYKPKPDATTNPKIPPFEINPNNEAAVKFFKGWQKDIEKRKQEHQTSMTQIHFLTGRIVAHTFAKAPLLFSLFGEEMPLTRLALGFVGAEVVERTRKNLVDPYLPKKPDPKTEFQPLLVLTDEEVD